MGWVNEVVARRGCGPISARCVPFDGLARAAKLLGAGVPGGLATQRLVLFGKGLLEHDAAALGRAGYVVAGNLQQTAVH